MNKNRINRVSAVLYEEKNLQIALREVTRYIIFAMISMCKFNEEGIMEDVTKDFTELRIDGILNPKDALSVELSLLSCILDFVEKNVYRDAISRESINPFVEMFISEIIQLSKIHMIDICNDHATVNEFYKVNLIEDLSNFKIERITYGEVNSLVLKMKEYQSAYNLLHNAEPMSNELN